MGSNISQRLSQAPKIMVLAPFPTFRLRYMVLSEDGSQRNTATPSN